MPICGFHVTGSIEEPSTHELVWYPGMCCRLSTEYHGGCKEERKVAGSLFKGLLCYALGLGCQFYGSGVHQNEP